MFLPLHDGVALRYLKRPYVTYGLIALNILIFAAVAAGVFGAPARVETGLGVIPAIVWGNAELAPGLALAPTWATFLTSMFLHGGVGHLVGNMLFLWVFGDNVEDAMGHGRFLAFYLACGLAGSLLFCMVKPDVQAPLIGASGAVSGVVTAYVMLYPRVSVFGLVFNWLPLTIPALYCIGAWIALQIGSALLGADAQVGWWAHVGGILAALALTPFGKRRNVALFDSSIA
jgi:membrane associated rhomboid family serine protease